MLISIQGENYRPTIEIQFHFRLPLTAIQLCIRENGRLSVAAVYEQRLMVNNGILWKGSTMNYGLVGLCWRIGEIISGRTQDGLDAPHWGAMLNVQIFSLH